MSGAMPAAVGIRMQYVPEFEDPAGFSILSDEEIRGRMREEQKRLSHLVNDIAENVDNISSAETYWYETNVVFNHEYEELINAFTNRASQGNDSVAGSKAKFQPGKSILQGVEGAIIWNGKKAESAALRENEVGQGEVFGRVPLEPPSSIRRTSTLKGTTLSLDQSAYHGTPYKFDKFSLEAIGSGEGAQAFGWGLYFAGKKKVGEFYRVKLPEARYRNI